jgi:predicted transcriptional regulator
VPKHNFKKFERSEIPPKFRIGESELKILQNLADYRFLDTNHLSALNPHLSERTIQRKLQNLFHAGYIDRPASQLAYLETSAHFIYAIGRKGSKLVFTDRRSQSNWTKKNKEVQENFLKHALMISNFRVILYLALQKIKGAKLAHWQEDDLRDSVNVKGERIPFAPDGFLTIEDKGDLLYFFLEADRSTMGDKKFLQKIKAYWQYWQEGRHIKKFNFDLDFRVLTITDTEGRKESLRKITRKADDSKKEGSAMFWFACEKSFNLENPKSILEQIWKSPKNDKYHYLLE